VPVKNRLEKIQIQAKTQKKIRQQRKSSAQNAWLPMITMTK
jgi:hypothetical protein